MNAVDLDSAHSHRCDFAQILFASVDNKLNQTWDLGVQSGGSGEITIDESITRAWLAIDGDGKLTIDESIARTWLGRPDAPHQ